MKFDAAVKERVTLQTLMPSPRLETWGLWRRLMEDLSFSDEENKLLQFRQNGKTTTWQEGKVGPKNIEIVDTMQDIVLGRVVELSRAGQLTADHFYLLDRLGWIEKVTELVAEADKTEKGK